ARSGLQQFAHNPVPKATVAVTNGTTTSGGTITSNPITFDTFRRLNPNSFSVTLPSLTLNLVESDADTKIIQNPEILSVDGQTAKLKIGQRISLATGSFQAGVCGGRSDGAGFVDPQVHWQL